MSVWKIGILKTRVPAPLLAKRVESTECDAKLLKNKAPKPETQKLPIVNVTKLI